MKINNNDNSIWSNNQIIDLKNNDWLVNQRIAGKIAARTLCLLEAEVKNKTKLSLIELNNLAEEFILQEGGELTFKGYKGFPCGVCISVNNELVHGIPTKRYLQDGDLVSFDLGVTIKGSIADTALTVIYGSPKSEQYIKLIKTTKECLTKAIESIKIGKKLGVIGNTIYKHARQNGFVVITKYGGHGLGIAEDGKGIAHSAPFISNRAEINEGVTIVPGMAIAIEPLLCIGSSDTKVLSDGWTVSTLGINSHEEHSIFIHENTIEIITDRTNLE